MGFRKLFGGGKKDAAKDEAGTEAPVGQAEPSSTPGEAGEQELPATQSSAPPAAS